MRTRSPHRSLPRQGGRGVALRLLCALVALAAGCGGQTEAPAPVAPVGIEVGNRAPELAGRLPSGEPFSLRPRGDGPQVVVFYRSEHCGLCRLRLEQLQHHLPAYRELGARVLAVTADPPELAARTAARAGGGLAIVSVDTAVLARWGVLSPETRVPLPATFLLDEDAIVRFRHLGRNAGDRANDASLLTILERARVAR